MNALKLADAYTSAKAAFDLHPTQDSADRLDRATVMAYDNNAISRKEMLYAAHAVSEWRQYDPRKNPMPDVAVDPDAVGSEEYRGQQPWSYRPHSIAEAASEVGKTIERMSGKASSPIRMALVLLMDEKGEIGVFQMGKNTDLAGAINFVAMRIKRDELQQQVQQLDKMLEGKIGG